MNTEKIIIPSAEGDGFLQVLETLGDDSTITKSARVSYAKGTKSSRQDRDLLRYLMRHRHNTPFEMCSIRLHIRCPIFVARQWFRHRTGSFNEISARYSEMEESFHVPHLADMRKTPEKGQNKQSSSESLPSELAQEMQDQIKEHNKKTHELYKSLLARGLSREIARAVLPQSMMTEFLWMVNLHNLLHFLELRSSPDAQKEISLYAWKIMKILEEWVPVTQEAFMDYRINAVNLSRQERDLVYRRLQQDMDYFRKEELMQELSPGEQREFRLKFH